MGAGKLTKLETANRYARFYTSRGMEACIIDGSCRSRQLSAPLFQFFRKDRLVAKASYNGVSLITLRISVQTRKGQVRHVPKENLECSLAS